MKQADSIIMVTALWVDGCSGMPGGYAYDQHEKSQGRP
jgi:hypothetical protein